MFSPTAKRKVFFSISAILVAVSIIFLIINGLNFGIDFTGGTTLQFDLGDTKYTSDIEKEIEDIVKKEGGVTDIAVQNVGENGVSIKTPELSNEVTDKIIEAIKEKYSLEQKNVLSNEKVSGTVSGSLIGDSFKAILLAVILMLVYISIRFDFKSGTCAVLALAHDIIIMLGFYAIFGLTVNTGFIAAVLTILGYSINATIIVFDRVRENRKMMKRASNDEMADDAIRRSYLRSINSSITTLVTIGALYLVGVTSIKEFALPIIVGIFAGTYSSLFIAAPFWAWWKNAEKK